MSLKFDEIRDFWTVFSRKVSITMEKNISCEVDFGHSLNLSIGWYDNNCICGEGSSHLSRDQVNLDVKGNIEFIVEMGFDALKADGCGPGRNMSQLVELLKETTEKKVFIENCHYDKIQPGQSMPSGIIKTRNI